MTSPLTLTVEEAAKLLGVGRGTAYSAVRAGEIPSVRIGRRVVVPTRPLLALLGADDLEKSDEPALPGEPIEDRQDGADGAGSS